MASGTWASASTRRRAVLGHFGLHLLLEGDRFGPLLFGHGAGHAGVGLGRVGLQAGADVLADLDLGDVDRDDLERRLRVEAAVEQRPRNLVGVRQHVLVRSWPSRSR